MVSRGPADPGNDFAPRDRWSHQWLYDVRDLTPFFEKGTNVIAAEVFFKGQPNYSLGKHGFVRGGDRRSWETARFHHNRSRLACALFHSVVDGRVPGA